MTDIQREVQALQLRQSSAHVKQLCAALIAYCDAVNLRVEIKIPDDKLEQWHHGKVETAHPDRILTDADLQAAASALHMLAIRTTLGHWPGFMQDHALKGAKVHDVAAPGLTIEAKPGEDLRDLTPDQLMSRGKPDLGEL